MSADEKVLTEQRLELLPRGATCACGIKVFSVEDRLIHAAAHLPPVVLDGAPVVEPPAVPPVDPPVDPERDPNTGVIVG